MTFTEFMAKWNGKYVEVAGSANAQNQCVDLANAYIRDVLNLPIIEWTNAKDFPSKGGDNYTYILNTPTGVPQEGDLVIWGGTYGHIAIFIEGDVNSFRSFDQNYPTGSPCHVQNHTTYNNVLGWMRPKQLAGQLDLQKQLDACRVERDRNWNWFTQICDVLGVGPNVDVAVAEAKKLVGIEDKYIQADRERQEYKNKIDELEQKLSAVSFKHTELVSDYAVLEEKLGDANKKIEEQGTEIQNLSKAITEAQNNMVEKLSGWQLIAKGIKRLLGGDIT